MTKKNPAAVALGRLGGRVSSEKKTRANRKNAKKKRTRRPASGDAGSPQQTGD